MLMRSNFTDPLSPFLTPVQTIGYSSSGVMIISKTLVMPPFIAGLTPHTFTVNDGHSQCFSNMNLFNGSYHCIRKMPDANAPHKYLYPLYGFRITQHCWHPFVSGTLVVSANFLGTNRSGIRFICIEKRFISFECNASKSCRYNCELLPDKLINTSLITYSHIVRLGYSILMTASCNSFIFKLKMPSSAPINKCWSLVSGWIHDAVQCMVSGQPLKIFEKHAPICTFGVGGNPFDTGRGGVWRRRCKRFGGTGGVLFKMSGWVSFSAAAATKRKHE